MHPDNETKIPESTEIELKPMSHFVIDELDGVAAVAASAAYEKMVKEQINALYGIQPKKKNEEEEWVWVDGYKGTEYDMTAYDDFQYKLNEMYSMPEDAEIEECKSGFHFCMRLGEVFRYYGIQDNHRFFKVRALVRKKDLNTYETYRRSPSLYFGFNSQDKLVAKKIILERELSVDEIFYADEYQGWSPEDKKDALKEGTCDVKKRRNIRILREAGFSETFSAWVAKNAGRMERALAVVSVPELSMDMKVFAIVYDD